MTLKTPSLRAGVFRFEEGHEHSTVTSGEDRPNI